jgi:hypothetical protein
VISPALGAMARTTYRLVIRAGIRDLAGNGLPAQTWNFRTGRS